jgi:3-hydroxy-9,10-secoandrosta-1,3,5(10)-triene-9,17-dione monooxygenase reductase component
VAGPIEADRFRAVLGHLPTGVTVITAIVKGRPVGMAANSVTSVSLDPPMILVCPSRTSSTWPQIRRINRFCLNVLASHHESLSRQFSRLDIDRFADVSWHSRRSGPALDESVAWLDCETHAEHEAGDHTIVVANVTSLDVQDRDALVFYKGRYGRFLDAGD